MSWWSVFLRHVAVVFARQFLGSEEALETAQLALYRHVALMPGRRRRRPWIRAAAWLLAVAALLMAVAVAGVLFGGPAVPRP